MRIKTIGTGLATCGVLLVAPMGSANTFNPQPDPPGFGIVSVNPDPTSRRALPTAEVFDTVSGLVSLHVNPQTPRVSLIYNGAQSR